MLLSECLRRAGIKTLKARLTKGLVRLRVNSMLVSAAVPHQITLKASLGLRISLRVDHEGVTRHGRLVTHLSVLDGLFVAVALSLLAVLAWIPS